MEIKELDEAESLVEQGDLKAALKRIDRARNRALGAQNIEAMSRVASAGEALQARADGRLRKAADKQVQLVEQNRHFLARATDSKADRAQVPLDLGGNAASDNVATAQAPTASEAFVARGRNGQLTVTPTKIIISRKGVSGFMLHGHKGEKEIDLLQISAVQFKKNGLATVGYIQFSFLGGGETKQGITDAAKDENAILFKKSQEADFISAKELLDEYRAALRTPVATPPPTESASVADELEKLAALRDKGVLNDEEFAAQKRKLLGL
jgi:hypothetical protein